mgnify:CR=1 FL=1
MDETQRQLSLLRFCAIEIYLRRLLIMCETVIVSFKEVATSNLDSHHVFVDLEARRKMDAELDSGIDRLLTSKEKLVYKNVPLPLTSKIMDHVKSCIDDEKLIVPHPMFHRDGDIELSRANDKKGASARKIILLFLDYLKTNVKLKERFIVFKGFKVCEDGPEESSESPAAPPTVEEPEMEEPHCSNCTEKDDQILRLSRRNHATRKRLSREDLEYDDLEDKHIAPKRSCQESYQDRIRSLQDELKQEKCKRSEVEAKNGAVVAQLDAFAKRHGHNELSPNMVYYIISNLVGNHMSVRQVEGTFQVMSSVLPMLKGYRFPSTGTVQKVIWSIPTLNDSHAVHYFNESTTFCVQTDGSKKAGKDILAALMVNEVGKPFVFDARECFSGDSEDHAEGILDMLTDIGNRAEALKEIEEGHAWPWVKTQLGKIAMAMSDSCNQALNVRKRLIDLIKDVCGMDKVILSGDCSMHQISNMEKHTASCLSSEAQAALKLCNEVLASSSLNSEKSKWERHIKEKQFSFRSEIGLRFSCKGHNAEVMVLKWDELKQFCLAHPTSKKLQQLQVLLTSSVRDEITAFASVWGICLGPLWNHLRTANVVNSIIRLEKFIALADESKVRCPVEVMTDGTVNKCIVDGLDSSVNCLKDGSTSQLMFQHLSLLELEDHPLIKHSLIDMLDIASKYVASLRRNWVDYENIPEGLLKNIGFTNQLVEQFFAVADFVLKLAPHACLFTRTEIARGMFNHLCPWLQSIDEGQRLNLVMKAYRHANDTRLGARNAEDILAEAHANAEANRYATVQHEYALVEQCYDLFSNKFFPINSIKSAMFDF